MSEGKPQKEMGTSPSHRDEPMHLPWACRGRRKSRSRERAKVEAVMKLPRPQTEGCEILSWSGGLL